MGEVSFLGIYVPMLMLLSLIALALAAALSRVLQLTGLYRFVAYRPLADVCLFLILLGLTVLATIGHPR